MKGMFDLLEKAGLVRRLGETPGADTALPEEPAAEAYAPAEPEVAMEPAGAAAPVEAAAPGLTLEQIYAAAGVPPSPYPAERLLRLIDGLKAMDEATRLTTIRAIDAADDSWSIDDPRRDAAAKVAALERHASGVRAALARAEQDTQARREQLAQQQERTLADIRRQIADLEGLLAREIARGTQEHASLEAALHMQREAANQELATLTRTTATLNGLIAQFAGTSTA
ncbi:MAG: methyl-accepting chemotaxis protein [Rubrivivax sp.]|nr:methyl-accepting chemotaxis protein [Rubrivivax sp.]